MLVLENIEITIDKIGYFFFISYSTAEKPKWVNKEVTPRSSISLVLLMSYSSRVLHTTTSRFNHWTLWGRLLWTSPQNSFILQKDMHSYFRKLERYYNKKRKELQYLINKKTRIHIKKQRFLIKYRNLIVPGINHL